MPLNNLYFRENDGVLKRVHRSTVYRRRKKIKALLVDAKRPIRGEALQKMVRDYCRTERIKTVETDEGLTVGQIGEVL